jgi:hypothetical protein
MRLTITTPDGNSYAGIHAHERFAFVDHPPLPRPEPEPEPDPLDPAYISTVRWKKKHVH